MNFDKYKLEGLNLVNRYRPIVTKEEKKELQTLYKNNNKDKAINWRDANLEKVRSYQKKFKINNKEQRIINDKVKYTCECGSICSIGGKSFHNKTKKHKQYKIDNIVVIKEKLDREEYKKQYRLKNKDKKKQTDKQYAIKNKDKIKENKRLYTIKTTEKRKQNNIDNKEKNKQYNIDNKEHRKQYREDNKDKIKELKRLYTIKTKEKRRQYCIDNKDKITQQRKIYDMVKYTCECGSTIRKSEKTPHNKTIKHIKYLATLI